MTHRLVVIIVKAQSKEEAEKKAQYALDNKICDMHSYVQDSGCIVSLEHARFQDARRFIRCVDSEDVQKFLSSYCYPKDFEQRKYTESWPKEDGTLEWIDYPEGRLYTNTTTAFLSLTLRDGKLMRYGAIVFGIYIFWMAVSVVMKKADWSGLRTHGCMTKTTLLYLQTCTPLADEI
jgi:hypothetical protein